jgi:hypothetical protein
MYLPKILERIPDSEVERLESAAHPAGRELISILQCYRPDNKAACVDVPGATKRSIRAEYNRELNLEFWQSVLWAMESSGAEGGNGDDDDDEELQFADDDNDENVDDGYDNNTPERSPTGDTKMDTAEAPAAADNQENVEHKRPDETREDDLDVHIDLNEEEREQDDDEEGISDTEEPFLEGQSDEPVADRPGSADSIEVTFANILPPKQQTRTVNKPVEAAKVTDADIKHLKKFLMSPAALNLNNDTSVPSTSAAADMTKNNVPVKSPLEQRAQETAKRIAKRYSQHGAAYNPDSSASDEVFDPMKCFAIKQETLDQVEELIAPKPRPNANSFLYRPSDAKKDSVYFRAEGTVLLKTHSINVNHDLNALIFFQEDHDGVSSRSTASISTDSCVCVIAGMYEQSFYGPWHCIYCPVALANRAVRMYQETVPKANYKDFINCVVANWFCYRIGDNDRVWEFMEAINCMLVPDYPELENGFPDYDTDDSSMSLREYNFNCF